MEISICKICECSIDNLPTSHERIPNFKADIYDGADVFIIDAAYKEKCPECGEESTLIPDMNGLIAAVALTRVKFNLKLTGVDIKFIRKVLDVSSKNLSEILEVTAETVSRWENDKLPMGPSAEKLFRLIAGMMLSDRAPAIDFDQKEIAKMNICAIKESTARIQMYLQLVKFKKDCKPTDAYTETDKKAA